jgi:hypothetical protein
MWADQMAVVGEQQRRTVRLRPGHGKGADGSTRAGPVFDDDPLLQPLPDRIGNHARTHVETAAGGDRNENADFVGQVLGPQPFCLMLSCSGRPDPMTQRV